MRIYLYAVNKPLDVYNSSYMVIIILMVLNISEFSHARLCDSLLTDRTQLKRCSLAFEVRPAKAVQLLPDSLSAPGTSAPGTQLPRREPAATRAGHSQAAPAGSSVDQQAGESGSPRKLGLRRSVPPSAADRKRDALSPLGRAPLSICEQNRCPGVVLQFSVGL